MLTPSFTWENSYLHSNTCARERPLTPGGQDREHGTQWTQCGENAVPLGENLCWDPGKNIGVSFRSVWHIHAVVNRNHLSMFCIVVFSFQPDPRRRFMGAWVGCIMSWCLTREMLKTRIQSLDEHHIGRCNMNFRCRTHGADNMIRYKYQFFRTYSKAHAAKHAWARPEFNALRGTKSKGLASRASCFDFGPTTFLN